MEDPQKAPSPAPMDADAFVRLDNRAAAAKVPKDVARITTPQRYLYTAGDAAPALEALKRADLAGAWQLRMPEGAIMGLPGRTLGRTPARELFESLRHKEDAQAGVAARMPDWVPFAPHAKLAMPRAAGQLRRVKGAQIEPHYGVFGADDRTVYYPSGYPWHCIGKVLVWSEASAPQHQWEGSAVLIGDRTILTCGHMVPWGSSSWKMKFIPAFYDGDSVLGAGTSSWVSDCHGYDTNNKVSAWDMAVCRLYEPLGARFGYFGTKNYSSSWEGGPYWTLAGYPGAIASGNRPSRQMWWPVDDDDSDGSAEEIEYRADATAGNSGGPVFGFWDGAPYCIATHSGGSKTTFLWWTTEDTNVGAGGSALNSIVAWARAAWPQ